MNVQMWRFMHNKVQNQQMNTAIDYFLTVLKDTEASHLLQPLASSQQQLGELSQSLQSHTGVVTLRTEPDGSISLSLMAQRNPWLMMG